MNLLSPDSSNDQFNEKYLNCTVQASTGPFSMVCSLAPEKKKQVWNVLHNNEIDTFESTIVFFSIITFEIGSGAK